MKRYLIYLKVSYLKQSRKYADKVIDNGSDIEKTRAQLEIMLGI